MTALSSPQTSIREVPTFLLGSYPGMSREVYENSHGVRQSFLKCWASGTDVKRTRATILVGQALHARLEGREKFQDQYEVLERQYNLATKEGKAALKEAHDKTGKTILNFNEFELVKAMFDAVQKDPQGRLFVESKGQREMCMFAKLNGGTGILKPHETICKGIIDLDGKSIWDFKTTNCLNQTEFLNSIVKYGYDAQAAMYQELYAATHGGEYKPFKWMCVSKQPPHEVWWSEATPYMMASGLRWIDTALTLYERYGNDRTE